MCRNPGHTFSVTTPLGMYLWKIVHRVNLGILPRKGVRWGSASQDKVIVVQLRLSVTQPACS